jgi:hypothetical protein
MHPAGEESQYKENRKGALEDTVLLLTSLFS